MLPRVHRHNSILVSADAVQLYIHKLCRKEISMPPITFSPRPVCLIGGNVLLLAACDEAHLVPAAPHHAAGNFHCIFSSVNHVPRVRVNTVPKSMQILPDDSETLTSVPTISPSLRNEGVHNPLCTFI